MDDVDKDDDVVENDEDYDDDGPISMI